MEDEVGRARGERGGSADNRGERERKRNWTEEASRRKRERARSGRPGVGASASAPRARASRRMTHLSYHGRRAETHPSQYQDCQRRRIS